MICISDDYTNLIKYIRNLYLKQKYKHAKKTPINQNTRITIYVNLGGGQREREGDVVTPT